MRKTINWGIIGAGKIARKFATDIKVVPNATLHAVASRSLEKAQAFRTEFGASHAFGSYEALLNCPDLDAVYVATPHVFHHEQTLMCLHAGVPVLCEKPFAMNQRQVEEMIAVAQSKKVFLMEAMWTRLLPTMQKVQEIITSGKIGTVFSVQADFGFKAPYDIQKRLYNKALGGGALLDIGIYPVFLALFVLGYPKQIKASAHIGATGVDEEIGMLFTYEQDKMANLHSTIRTYTPIEAFIYGEKGTIKLHTRWFTATSMSLKLHDQEHEELIEFDYKSGGFEYEIEEASNCILAGKIQSSILSHDFSLQLIRLLDAIRQEIGLVYNGLE